MFIDQNCTIEHNGQTFESGGAFIAERADTGKLAGVVYAQWADPKTDPHITGGYITNWHGDIKIRAYFGREYRSNFGDKRRSVWFTYKGREMFGVWCSTDWNQLVRVREIKPTV